MYSIGDRIAHPMHGAGIIEDITQQRVDSVMRQYYVVRMSYGAMTIMVPCDCCDSIGIRAVIDEQQADMLISKLHCISVVENQNWNKRYRDNILKIKSGNLLEVATVVKMLLTREQTKTLSTGERKLLGTAKQILASEIMLAKNIDYSEIEKIINTELMQG